MSVETGLEHILKTHFKIPWAPFSLCPLCLLLYLIHFIKVISLNLKKQTTKTKHKNQTNKQTKNPQILLFFLCCECIADDLLVSAQTGEMQRELH